MDVFRFLSQPHSLCKKSPDTKWLCSWEGPSTLWGSGVAQAVRSPPCRLREQLLSSGVPRTGIWARAHLIGSALRHGSSFPTLAHPNPHLLHLSGLFPPLASQ